MGTLNLFPSVRNEDDYNMRGCWIQCFGPCAETYRVGLCPLIIINKCSTGFLLHYFGGLRIFIPYTSFLQSVMRRSEHASTSVNGRA